MYMMITALDEDNHPASLRICETVEETQERISDLQSRGMSAFYIETDATHKDARYVTIDPADNSFTFDTVKKTSDAAARAAEKVQKKRRQAYQAEADTLYFEEQAGEVSAGTWAAKRAEIKSRYPK